MFLTHKLNVLFKAIALVFTIIFIWELIPPNNYGHCFASKNEHSEVTILDLKFNCIKQLFAEDNSAKISHRIESVNKLYPGFFSSNEPIMFVSWLWIPENQIYLAVMRITNYWKSALYFTTFDKNGNERSDRYTIG